MKKILNTVILFISIGCSSQNPVINIENNHSTDEGVYNKDVNDLLNQFEGTYIYTNGMTSLKIILSKKVMQYNGKYYEDLMIGEYEYKVNNIVVISTLSNLNVVFPNQKIDHSIGGNRLLKNTSRPPCNDCTLNEKRLLLGFSDPTTSFYGEILIQKVVQNGAPAIKTFIRATGGGEYVSSLGQQPPPNMKVPGGAYVLIKQ